MKTILLTGARAPVTLDLARALAEAGHRVIAAESMEYPLSIHSKSFDRFFKITAPNVSLDHFLADLLQITQSEKVDLMIPTCEEAFHVSKVKEELSSHTEVFVDSFDVLARLHSKVQFNHWVKGLGFSAPETEGVQSLESMLSAIRKMPGEKVVLKPEYSRFASKTLILDKAEALVQAPHIFNGLSWTVQECLEGVEYCTYSIAKGGVLLSHVTYDHEFTAGKGAGICFKSIHHVAIEQWVSQFVAATHFTGQIAFDFIDNGAGLIQPLECNPRATSGLHLVAQEVKFLDALLGPTNSQMIARPREGAIGQLRLAMLVYGLPSIRSLKSALSWIKIFWGAREVVLSLRDPLPFFDQFVSFYQLIRESSRRGITPLEVSTQDIEWNGP